MKIRQTLFDQEVQNREGGDTKQQSDSSVLFEEVPDGTYRRNN